MYKKLSLSNYEKERLKHYTNTALSRFELSHSFKINKMKNSHFIYSLSKIVNDTQELKRSVIENEAIQFHKINPAYVLLKNNEICNTFTEFDYDFNIFLSNYEKDYELFLKKDLCFCIKQAPENSFYISSFKSYFNSFSLHLKNGYEFYAPIFTTYKKVDELIIYANFHHAFFDLSKAKIFFEKLEFELKSFNTDQTLYR
ncbi:TPA: hypothetical protein SHD19_000902 [Campylobacter coli]|nr:hypothetical protein [Campylobacter coli]HEH4983039.1 hypothetical protein [Campylobacter coli]HEH4989787.1 hypothetical protein [Campylobacter coli]HEH5122482.1 hypothetical protein [Campylobacter coli]HEH5452873.1 hypothetical protein [Campylobacter coli]